MNDHSLPYGLNDLDPKLTRSPDKQRVRCVVRGCRHWLKPPANKPKFVGEVCPDHGLIVHSGGTWSYTEYRRNLIIDGDYFHRHIRYHPFKTEAHRFGSERSEDALTWNVFRSLQQAGILHRVVRLATGIEDREPHLLLWGLQIEAKGVAPWDLLVRARERFESDLPVNRPETEPDIVLYLPGRYVILIEAKFCSPNSAYRRDNKTRLFDLTIDQVVHIYQDPKLVTLDYAEAASRDCIYGQLWRNVVFAEQIARYDGARTEWFHINLVRAGREAEVCAPLLTLLHTDHRHRFEQITWEQVFGLVTGHPGLEALGRYGRFKTERLKPAFNLGTP